MIFKKFSLWAAAAGISLLAGCNLFNPNGAEESSCPSDNAECYIALGQSLINQEKFEASMAAYSKAIAIDSTKSNAYWGYATAAKFRYNMNLVTLLEDLQEANKKDTLGNPIGLVPFLRHSNADIELRINVATRVSKVLGRLSERDSLTQWWRYMTDSTNRTTDPHFASRKAFISAYLAANATDPSRSAAHFPLSDGKKKFGDAKLHYMPYLLLSATLGSCDLPPKNQFNDDDRSWCNILLAGATGGGLSNLDDLAEKMKNDPVFQQNVNNQILDLQNGLSDLGTLLSQFDVSSTPSDSGGAPAQSQGEIDSLVSGLGGTMVFFQFGDGLDNDGDGCVDEEIVDGFDNDLDGFVDEDARLLKGNSPLANPPSDGVNNDHAGLTDDFRENLAGPILGGDRHYALTFVVDYLVANDEVGKEEEQTTWVKIKKRKDQPNNDPQMALRIAVQNDSLAVPGRSSQPGYAAKLLNAKNVVGGCWRNY